MDEYIAREATYTIAKKICDAIRNGEYHSAVFALDIMDWIDDVPAADVVPGSDFRDCVNELCLRCGQYQQEHSGACDGCRWLKARRGR